MKNKVIIVLIFLSVLFIKFNNSFACCSYCGGMDCRGMCSERQNYIAAKQEEIDRKQRIAEYEAKKKTDDESYAQIKKEKKIHVNYMRTCIEKEKKKTR